MFPGSSGLSRFYPITQLQTSGRAGRGSGTVPVTETSLLAAP